MVDESGMMRTQMGTNNTSETGRSALDALYDITQQQYPVTSSFNILGCYKKELGICLF
jgi:hypothetical protein